MSALHSRVLTDGFIISLCDSDVAHPVEQLGLEHCHVLQLHRSTCAVTTAPVFQGVFFAIGQHGQIAEVVWHLLLIHAPDRQEEQTPNYLLQQHHMLVIYYVNKPSYYLYMLPSLVSFFFSLLCLIFRLMKMINLRNSSRHQSLLAVNLSFLWNKQNMISYSLLWK